MRTFMHFAIGLILLLAHGAAIYFGYEAIRCRRSQVAWERENWGIPLLLGGTIMLIALLGAAAVYGTCPC